MIFATRSSLARRTPLPLTKVLPWQTLRRLGQSRAGGISRMTYFYKGVGVGTFLHKHDLRITGIVPAGPSVSLSLAAVMQHVTAGAFGSPCISVTRSYAVAEDYARNASHNPPTPAAPAYVYLIDIPSPLPAGVTICDPVELVAQGISNPLTSPSYHHNGNQSFLLAVAGSRAHAAFLTSPPVTPPGLPGSVPSPPILTAELKTMVFALRDAEALVVGNLPRVWVIDRYDII